MGKQWRQWQTLYSWAPKSLQRVTAAKKLKDTSSLNKSYDKPRWHIKKQRRDFASKGLSNQSGGFSSGHVWMWKFNHKEGWVLKNWCFWAVVLEKTVSWTARRPNESIKNQSWIFDWKPEAEAEAPILCPPDAKSRLTGKAPDAGKDWRHEEKGTTEDEMVGWHHRLRREFELALGDSERQGSLACCSPWGHKESDTTEQPNNNMLSVYDSSLAGKQKLLFVHVKLPISSHSKIKESCFEKD